MNSQNTSTTAPLHTETPDHTPDMGPKKRGDTPVWFGAIVSGVAAVTLAIAFPAFFWLPLVALGLPAALCGWSIYTTYRDRVDAPRSHNVLAGELGFDLITTCRGVVATAFFSPDSVAPGGATAFYVFLENYMSRQRVVHVRLGHLPGIGRPEATHHAFHLAAGQAAVCVMPVQMQPGLAAGHHRLSVQVTVAQPAGVGQRLSGTRAHIHSARKVRIAAPFELAGGRTEPAAPRPALAKPRYISLASVNEKTPDIDRLLELAG